MKVALITGAGRGIGYGCAQAFVRAGYLVAMAERDEAQGRSAQASLRAEGGRAELFGCDVSQESQVTELFSELERRLGRLDALVNNAGTNRPGSPLETSLEHWNFLITTNLTSAFLCCRAAIPLLLRSGGGAIVNMTSLAGLFGQRDGAAYASSKAGMIGLTKSLALDLSAQGIRVNALAPGNVDTPLMEQWISQQKDPAAVRQRITSAQLVGRLAGVTEIGEMALFLATQPFLTGVVLEAEGGASLGY
jgi:2-deoxy-D-gluconate 3-dehydrogenase